jgi:hypothetical protein
MFDLIKKIVRILFYTRFFFKYFFFNTIKFLFYLKFMFVFRKVIFEKLLFKLSCVYLLLRKLVNEKHFPVKEKFGLIFRKVFSFYFGRKTLSGSCEKFRNVILFVDYIKFDLQTFDCYIYFILNIFFNFIH